MPRKRWRRGSKTQKTVKWRMTARPEGRSGGCCSNVMLVEQLKSKIHRAMITRGDVQYEGSIEIPADLMAAVDLWPGEKVLVASVTSGNRLETYALQGPAGTGNIIMNGGAAHLIKTGERVVIMSFALSDKPIIPKKIVCNEHNEIIS